MNKGQWAIITLVLVITLLPLTSLGFAQTEEKLPVTQTIQIIGSDNPLDPYVTPTINTMSKLGEQIASSSVLIASFLIIIFVGWVLGRIAYSIVKRVIKRIFENPKLLSALGMKAGEFEGTSWSEVHNLIPYTVKWFVWLGFFVVAIDILGVTEASSALAGLWTWLPRLITFIILISVGFISTKVAIKWMTDTKPELFGESGSMKVAKGIVQAIIFAVVFGIGITTLGIGEQIIPIIFWVVLSGIMGSFIAISIGFKGIAKCWAISESIKKEASIGQKLKVGEYEGELIKFGITHTVIKTDKGKTLLLPNELYESNVVEISGEPKEKKNGKQN